MTGRLARLRDDFDTSFARPAGTGAGATVDLIDIGTTGGSYAVRLADVAALHTDRTPTPLPGTTPHLLGVAGLAGTLVPVYDLAAILGHPPAPGARWLVVTVAAPAVALAFTTLGGHLRVPADAVTAGSPALVRTATGSHPVIDLAAVHATVLAAVRHPRET